MKKSDVMNSRKNMICGFLYLICQNVRPTVCVEHFGETHNGYKNQMYTSLMMVTALATKFVDGSNLNLSKAIQILKHIKCNQKYSSVRVELNANCCNKCAINNLLR